MLEYNIYLVVVLFAFLFKDSCTRLACVLALRQYLSDLTNDRREALVTLEQDDQWVLRVVVIAW